MLKLFNYGFMAKNNIKKFFALIIQPGGEVVTPVKASFTVETRIVFT